MTRLRLWLWGGAALVVVVVAGLALWLGPRSRQAPAAPVAPAARTALATNPNLDPGTSLPPRPAPPFTLTDQFGRPVSLASFRGRVVLLAFIDAECTTICPLTSTEMALAQRMLGPAGRRLALVAVDANPTATSVADVRAYSAAHGLTHAWTFATGTPRQLARVWRRYGIYVQVVHGLIDHTPALYLLDTRGRERRIFMSQMAYSAITQQAQVLAQAASALMPSHPPVHSDLSYRTIPGLGPGQAATLATLAGGHLRLAPGQARVVVFFATWVAQTSDLRAELLALNRYVATAHAQALPPLVAVDELPTEAGLGAVRRYVKALGTRLAYPVALDADGRLADGYGVQDIPWIAVVSPAGRIVASHDGWLAPETLAARVRRALGGRAAGGP